MKLTDEEIFQMVCTVEQLNAKIKFEEDSLAKLYAKINSHEELYNKMNLQLQQLDVAMQTLREFSVQLDDIVNQNNEKISELGIFNSTIAGKIKTVLLIASLLGWLITAGFIELPFLK